MVIGVAAASQPCLHHAITADPEVNMRPGQGLVVMALAFISVARRGDTSQSIVHNFETDSDLMQDNEAGYLAQINPWLSACDVANPIKAPDLQVNKYNSISYNFGDYRSYYYYYYYY